MKAGRDKCRAEDPNNCRIHHTGRYANGKGEIPPPFDAKRAQSLLKYAFAKPMELVQYAPPELSDIELKEDARKLPVEKAVAAVLPYADAFGKRLGEVDASLAVAKRQIAARKAEIRKEISRISAMKADASEEKVPLMDSHIDKRSRMLMSMNASSRDLVAKTYAQSFSDGELSQTPIGEVGEGVDAISVDTLRFSASRMFSSRIVPKSKVNIVSTNGGRSRTGKSGIELSAYEDAETLVHEYAHFIENNNPHVLERCSEFLEHRCKGEESKPLSEMGDLGTFGEDEQGRKDKFFHAYCGKDYFDENGRRCSTEVFSMGVEMMLTHPKAFYDSDREYFAFVVGLMKGII